MVMIKKSEIENIRAELLKNVGVKIQQVREEKGLSQSKLIAKMIGEFNVTNLSRIENGHNNPTIFTLFRIAQALEISLPQLLEYEISKN